MFETTMQLSTMIGYRIAGQLELQVRLAAIGNV